MIILKIIAILYLLNGIHSKGKRISPILKNSLWDAVDLRIKEIEQRKSKLQDLVNSSSFVTNGNLKIGITALIFIDLSLTLVCIWMIFI